jgi:hypothetical protein
MDKLTFEDGIRITVEYDNQKLVLEVPSDLDIWDWEKKFRLILNFLTFNNEVIDDILIDEEKEFEKELETEK